MERQTGLFENALIWFGAAVSIAEILTGILIAPLGFKQGMAAILIGHVLGCILLFLAGVIGGKTRMPAMGTVKRSFGHRGFLLFAILNIVQLIGWTSIMIFDGALAAEGLFSIGHGVWALIIGVLILVWLAVGITNLGVVNTIAMGALFVLTLLLSRTIFTGATPVLSAGGMTFGAAVELSVAMPLSWLPLIADYTQYARKPVKASATSAIVYGVASTWMYMIGMGAALYTGAETIPAIIMAAGLGMLGLGIIVLSTVTTTFLDVFSAGISGEVVHRKINAIIFAVCVTILGVIMAVFLPIQSMTNFLYFIGSVFAPMIGILLADYFLLGKDASSNAFDMKNIILWMIGFGFYRFMLHVDTPIGSTIPSVVTVIVLAVLVNSFKK